MATEDAGACDFNRGIIAVPHADGVAVEWPVAEKAAEIKQIADSEVHGQIMTRKLTIEEGIEEMNTRVAGLFE